MWLRSFSSHRYWFDFFYAKLISNRTLHLRRLSSEGKPTRPTAVIFFFGFCQALNSSFSLGTTLISKYKHHLPVWICFTEAKVMLQYIIRRNSWRVILSAVFKGDFCEAALEQNSSNALMCISHCQKGNKKKEKENIKPAWKWLKINKTWAYFTSATSEREKEWGGGSESDWERNVPLWLDPHCSNRNQVLDSGVNVFPCIFLGKCGLNRFRPDSITCFVIQWNNSHVRLSCQFYILQASLYKLWPLRALTSA